MPKTQYVKYPRTPHLPWSPGRSGDDILLDSIWHLEKLADVVVAEKLDGENTTLYQDSLHARSVDGASHGSRNYLKLFHHEICLSWDDTVAWCKNLELEPTPVLYRGKWDETQIRSCWRNVSFYGSEQEG